MPIAPKPRDGSTAGGVALHIFLPVSGSLPVWSLQGAERVGGAERTGRAAALPESSTKDMHHSHRPCWTEYVKPLTVLPGNDNEDAVRFSHTDWTVERHNLR